MSVRSIVLFVLCAGISTAQNNQIYVAFSDLPQLIEITSLHLKIINAEHKSIIGESEIALQWSNPKLNYDFEQVEFDGQKETEQSIFLSKSFDFPWNYLQERNIWQSEMNAADLKRDQSVNQLLAETRTSYVHLALLQNLTEQLAELTKILNDLQQTLAAQHEEGALSQLDATLLSMSLFEFESGIIETKQEYYLAMSNWKNIHGIDVMQEVHLKDSITFVNIPTNNLETAQLLENHLGLQARLSRLDVLNQRLSLEKWKTFPSFSLQGGYKKVDPRWEGYVFGVSLPLPILNLNGPQIEKQKLEHRIFDTETSLYKQELLSQIQNLIFTIRENEKLFKKYDHNRKIVEELVVAYWEGILTLPDFLNAIQLVRENKRHYVEQLVTYYQAVFELEALCGQQLVTF